MRKQQLGKHLFIAKRIYLHKLSKSGLLKWTPHEHHFGLNMFKMASHQYVLKFYLGNVSHRIRAPPFLQPHSLSPIPCPSKTSQTTWCQQTQMCKMIHRVFSDWLRKAQTILLTLITKLSKRRVISQDANSCRIIPNMTWLKAQERFWDTVSSKQSQNGYSVFASPIGPL